MHREIQIKQFTIVTTHWWPKTKRVVCVRKRTVFISFFTSCTQPCPSDLSAHTHPVCEVCVRAFWLTLHSHGASASTLDGGRVWSVVLARRHSYNNQSHTSLVLHERDWVFAWGDLIGWRLRWRLKSCVSTTLQTRPPSSVDADAPCECSVSQNARTHTSHTGCVCALRSLGHGCVQEVKNDINTVRFLTQTTRFVLGHQCVVTMVNCLIWISLCMFFFPLIETVTYTCHYMTDRLERFDLKTSKLDLLKKKKTPTSWMPLG